MLYTEFWRRFLERVHAEHPDWTRAQRTGPENWYEMKSPITGTYFSYTFVQHDRLRLELYIDSGDAEKNQEIFERIRSRKEEMERAYGGEASWEELPDRRACRVAVYKDGECTVLERDRQEEFIDWMLSASARFRNALTIASTQPM